MGEAEILQLAQKFLFSEKGKKLIGKDIDLSSIENQIKTELQSKIQDLKSKGENIDVTKKSDKTREERKQDRQDARVQNREEREKRRDERKKEREARKERGGTVGQFIPKFADFITRGRLYDKFNSQPLDGVKVQIAIREPLQGLIIPVGSSDFNPPTSDLTGEFTINYRLPYLPFNNKIILEEVFVLYTKEGYLPLTQPILTGEREAKTYLSPFPLVSLSQAADEALPEYLGEYYPIYKDIREGFLAPKEKLLIIRKKQILKSVKTIQTTLLPLVIELLLAFGITKLSEKNQKTCPPIPTLENNVQRRNRVVRQLNNLYRQVTLNVSIAAALTAIASVVKSGKDTIQNLQLPLGTPVGVGVPYSVVSKLQAVEAVLSEYESDNKELNKQIINSLILLTTSITAIVILLKLLDELTQECSTELNIQPEAISQELIDLNSEAEEEGVVSVSNINGFTLEVQTIEDNAVGDLKRRQAVGKNSQGIIMVKGDPSFSSSDQILLNELAFYIQSNNLKAF